MPIIVNQDGVLLDGYTRLRACKELGITPRTMTRQFEDPFAEKKFIIEVNLKRRHLVLFQAIELAHKLEEIERIRAQTRQSVAGKTYGRGKNGKQEVDNSLASRETRLLLDEEEKGKTAAKIAEKIGVSQSTYERAKRIIEDGTEEQKEALRSGRDMINPVYNEILRRNKKEMLLKSIAEQGFKLPDNIKLIEGDFRLVSEVIPDKCIDLIFTDPPYAKKDVDLFTGLGELAYQKLREGGNLVTYCGTGNLLEAGNRVSSAGLKYVWTIPIILTGLSAAVHLVKINVKYKPLLWFAKGDKPNIFVSKPPEKILHEWEQSAVEAEFIISKLTLPNQLVLDPQRYNRNSSNQAPKTVYWHRKGSSYIWDGKCMD
ncbi:MAG: hypothetical protein M3P08_12310 [Thermoproteota archaeon]|nr:hypothetical protein [Thermoproteota archaeon]